ncbi:MAG: beta-lactamase family protein [Acidobacteria bacterium]|nr:beta-lactamase family protein [Acidobacteriota bacterium]
MMLAIWILFSGLLYSATPQEVAEKAKLEQLMRDMHVPAVSVAVLQNGKIAWAHAWGATPDTLFQAASISKPVAALAALHFSQYGNFTLDEDVNGKLKSWKVPENEFTREKKVTLRGILSHSAGITVHGFPGYATDAPIPSVVQILNGEKPANTAAIRVDVKPGSLYRYSGGGYTVMQQLLIDRLGKPFPEIMDMIVLRKLGMTNSTYEQPLPTEKASRAAIAHGSEGKPITGKWHVYPEMAAAGLWTTPTDLARFAIEVREAWLGRSNKVIEQGTARQMLTRQVGSHGLGPSITGSGNALTFGHGGSNAGFRCGFSMVLSTGHGAVVMTNGDRGGRVAQQVILSIAELDGWPTGWDK